MNQIDVVLPELKCSGTSWYVEYQAFRPATQKLERFRVYKGFAKLKTEVERKAHATTIIHKMEAKLRSGWRPWARNDVLYTDELASTVEVKKYGDTRKDDFAIRRYTSLFLAKKKSEDLSEKSISSYKSILKDFTTWIEKNGYSKLRPDEVTNAHIQSYFSSLKAQGLERATIAKRKMFIAGFFAFLKKKGVVRDTPVFDIDLPKKKIDHAARPMLEPDVEQILTAAAKNNPQFVLACLMQMLLGCRPGKELRLMKVGDIDLYNKRVYVGPQTGKTGQRIVQMPDALVEICRQMGIDRFNREYYVFGSTGEPGKQPLAINAMGNTFRALRKELGLPDTYKFYSFKHTGAGQLLESGATIIEVMGLLGHTDINSTLHYIKRHFGERSEKVTNFYPNSVRGIMGLLR